MGCHQGLARPSSQLQLTMKYGIIDWSTLLCLRLVVGDPDCALDRWPDGTIDVESLEPVF
jgi:hypothetical protein